MSYVYTDPTFGVYEVHSSFEAGLFTVNDFMCLVEGIGSSNWKHHIKQHDVGGPENEYSVQ